MTHARQKIRAAVAAMLADLQTTGRRVYPSRVFSLDEDELPSWGVYSKTEPVTKITLGGVFHRELELVLEGRAIADDFIDDKLDTMAAEAEAAMAAALVVDTKELPTIFRGTEIEFSGDEEAQIGLIRITYTIPYATQEGAPDTVL